MGKSDVGGLKAMAKHSKMIGLQKLRFYCQMCEKQCRDENGFKCHITTEGHLRQMQLFAENSEGILNDFSTAFKSGYLDILSRRHGTKRVEANKVYQEYIADKSHVHMNSTQWTTLTDFCKYLGRESLAVVDETENGWYVQYIDRDPRAMARQALAASLQKKDMDDEERSRRRIQAQIAAAAAETGELGTEAQQEGQDGEGGGSDGAASFQSVRLSSDKLGKSKRPRSVLQLEEEGSDVRDGGGTCSALASAHKRANTGTSSSNSTSSAPSGIELLMLEEQRKTAAREQHQQQQQQQQQLLLLAQQQAAALVTAEGAVRQEDWLTPGIVVRIMNQKVGGGRFYKQRGLVRRVIDTFIAEIELLDDASVIKIDQQELETVVPKAGKKVCILNGRGRGSTGTLLAINADEYNCTVRVDDGPFSGEELPCVEYEDICRMG